MERSLTLSLVRRGRGARVIAKSFRRLAAAAAIAALGILAPVARADHFEVAPQGGDPAVALDPSGARAYVAWEAPGPENAGDHVFVCRIPVGDTACEHTADLGLIGSNGDPTLPFVFAPDDHTVVVAAASSSRPARELVWTSADKGETFTGRASPFQAADRVVLDGDTLIGEWAETGPSSDSLAMFVSAAPVGSAASGAAKISADHGGNFSWLAVIDKTPVIAFRDIDPLANTTYVSHLLSPGANINDSANWSSPTSLGKVPYFSGLAGGPSALFAFTTDDST